MGCMDLGPEGRGQQLLQLAAGLPATEMTLKYSEFNGHGLAIHVQELKAWDAMVLRNLSLGNELQLPPAWPSYLPNAVKQLQVLVLHLDEMDLARHRNAEKLEWMTFLGSAVNLDCLTLAGTILPYENCNKWVQDMTAVLQPLQKLRSLELDALYMDAIVVRSLGRLVQLTQLCVKRAVKLTNPLYDMLLTQLSRLRKLTMEVRCSSFKMPSWEHSLQQCPTLEDLQLSLSCYS